MIRLHRYALVAKADCTAVHWLQRQTAQVCTGCKGRLHSCALVAKADCTGMHWLQRQTAQLCTGCKGRLQRYALAAKADCIGMHWLQRQTAQVCTGCKGRLHRYALVAKADCTDAGRFQDCISQGTDRFKEIVLSAQQIKEDVHVTLFGDAAFLNNDKLDFAVQKNKEIVGDIHTREVTWASFLQEKTRVESTVTVISIQSLEEQVVKDLEAKISQMPEAERHNVIVFIADAKVNFQYQVLANAGFILEDVRSQSDSERSVSLKKQIQYLLEEKLISMLEDIVAYNDHFTLKKQQDISELPIDAVKNKLERALSDSYVVNDLSPYGKEKCVDGERKPTDSELFKISGAIKSDWELLGTPLGITPEKVKEMKQSHQTEESKAYHMLLQWKLRDGATLKYLLEIIENVSRVTNFDMAVLKGIEEDSLILSSESNVDKIFHKNLNNLFAKTTRSVMCGKLSQKLGISPSLVNEFLNEFGFEKKVEEMMAAMSFPSWPCDSSQKLVSVVHDCMLDLTNIIQETERYVTTKHDLMSTLKKLQFELYGLLQQTDVVMDTKIPAIPKLPEKLQHALLQIPEIYGCGTIWGMLELHLTADLSETSEEDVTNTLRKYKYTYGYTTHHVEKMKKQVRETIEQGKGLLAKKLKPDAEGEYKYGTIGCFVKVTPHGAGNEGKIHCLTCAHCLSDCDAQVQIQNRQGLVNLGTRLYVIYRGEAIDVASIEIDQCHNRNCEKTLKDSADFPLGHNWSFYQGPPLRMSVFKYGSASGLTLGVCISMDYKTKQMLEYCNRRKNTNFHPDCNILIAPPANEPQDAHIEGTEGAAGQPVQAQANINSEPFSVEGDSGAVVCDDNINTGDVTVISLLCGDLKEEIGNQTRFLYSYTTDIQKVVSELMDTYNCQIEPAC